MYLFIEDMFDEYDHSWQSSKINHHMLLPFFAKNRVISSMVIPCPN